jgi:hypothetical protein
MESCNKFMIFSRVVLCAVMMFGSASSTVVEAAEKHTNIQNFRGTQPAGLPRSRVHEKAGGIVLLIHIYTKTIRMPAIDLFVGISAVSITQLAINSHENP